METVNVFDILRRHYPANEYALMAEVRDKAGFDASRSADYIAVNLWPSRGLHFHGIEVKSGRGDWLNELKRPEKAENIMQYCDFFWLLTTGDNIAKLEEIPTSWGWKTIRSGKITLMKDAPKLEPKNLSRHFVCAMLKRASNKQDYVHQDAISDRIREAVEQGKQNSAYELQHLQAEVDSLNKAQKEFEELSGVRMNLANDWNLKGKAAAIHYITNHPIAGILKNLEHLENNARDIHARIAEGVAIMKAIEEKKNP